LKPRRPYLLRALHEWISDSGETPHIVVDAAAEGVTVPRQYVKDGKIVLNVSFSATQMLKLGNDFVSFEARFGGVGFAVLVPVLNLGATRRFLIRPNGGGRSTVFVPAGGDLIIMRGRCQRDWQHCVPKQQAPTGPRMSLNYTSTAQVIT